MLVTPGPPWSRKIGANGRDERERTRVNGSAISRDFELARFSGTTNVPQSAGIAPCSVLYVHACIVTSPALAPARTEIEAPPPGANRRYVRPTNNTPMTTKATIRAGV